MKGVAGSNCQLGTNTGTVTYKNQGLNKTDNHGRYDRKLFTGMCGERRLWRRNDCRISRHHNGKSSDLHICRLSIETHKEKWH